MFGEVFCCQNSLVSSSILVIVPTLAQIAKKHNEINPTKLEWLKKMLDDKEVALVKRAEEVEQWMKKEVDAQGKLRATYKLLLQKK